MKIKVIVTIAPNGQGKNDKSREIVKTIEIDNKREFIRLGEIVQ